MAKTISGLKNRKEDGAKDKAARDAEKLSLAALVGKKVSTMSKAEQESLLIIIGQAVGLLDDKGIVKPL